MHRICSRKIICTIVLLLLFANSSDAQVRRKYKEFIDKPYYFGITLGLNWSDYKIDRSQEFIYSDSINSILSKRLPGFNLYIIGNLSLGRYFDVRATPGLSFADRNLWFDVQGKEVLKKVEAVNLDFPIHMRFKSEPMGDFRFYILGGMKFSADLASNSQARKAPTVLKVSPIDYSVEYGVGFQLFFQYFILSPEIKISQGIPNVIQRNRNLIYSRSIDGLNTRMISLSFHFEG